MNDEWPDDAHDERETTPAPPSGDALLDDEPVGGPSDVEVPDDEHDRPTAGDGETPEPAPEPTQESSQQASDGPAIAASAARVELPVEPGLPFVDRPPGAHEIELPIVAPPAREGEFVDWFFPPERRPAGELDSPQFERMAPPAGAPPEQQPVGEPLPRVQVLVTLHDARTLFAAMLDEAWQRMAPRFQKLAAREIEHAFFRKQAAERAADWRLRGP